jgi:hypothetical protein
MKRNRGSFLSESSNEGFHILQGVFLMLGFVGFICFIIGLIIKMDAVAIGGLLTLMFGLWPVVLYKRDGI